MSQEVIALIYADEEQANKEMVTRRSSMLPRVSSDGTVHGHRRRFEAELRSSRRAGGCRLSPCGTEAATRLGDGGDIGDVRSCCPDPRLLRHRAAGGGDGERRPRLPRRGAERRSPRLHQATWLYQLANACSRAEDPLTGPLPVSPALTPRAGDGHDGQAGALGSSGRA